MIFKVAKRLAESDQVARNKLGALMNELVKRVLPVGSGLTPDDRPSLVAHGLAVEIHVLSVALHLQLLQVSWKAFEIVRVGHDAEGWRAEKIVVPGSKQAHQQRKIFLRRCRAEVLVHVAKSAEQIFEPLRTDRDHGGKSDRGIHRIAPSDPVPESEHVGGIDSKFSDAFRVG